MMSVRQKPREAMAAFMRRRVELCDWYRRPSGGRNPNDSAVDRAEEDVALRAPGSSPEHSVTHRENLSACKAHGLQLAAFQEPNRAAIGRPEWIAGPFGSRDLPGGCRIEIAHP